MPHVRCFVLLICGSLAINASATSPLPDYITVSMTEVIYKFDAPDPFGAMEIDVVMSETDELATMSLTAFGVTRRIDELMDKRIYGLGVPQMSYRDDLVDELRRPNRIDVRFMYGPSYESFNLPAGVADSIRKSFWDKASLILHVDKSGNVTVSWDPPISN